MLKFKPKFEQQNTVSAEDAAIAVDCGVNGIIVSNHGARQLDTVLSTVRSTKHAKLTCLYNLIIFLDRINNT